MKSLYKNLIITASFFAALVTHAATDENVAQLTLSSSPASPTQGQVFTVEAKTYSTDPLRSNFRWLLNGKLIASGLGITSQTFTAANLGATMKIDVSLTTPDGQVFSKSLTIYIGDVDLIINPLTYVPSFYRGSPLASAAGSVEVYAVPHLYSSGAKIASQNLIYEWYLNDEKIGNQSGQGRDKMIFSLFDSGGTTYSVKLKVSSISGSVTAGKSLTIKPFDPQIIFYKTDPLLGHSKKSRVSFEIQGGQNASVLAEPYFFGLNSLSSAAVIWTADGKEFKQPQDKNPFLLEIAAPQNAVSLTNFSLTINDKRTIHQNSAGQFNIKTNQ